MIAMALLLAAGGIQTADNPDGAPGPKMICRNIELTGTYLRGHRLCKTKENWERFDRGNHEKVESINDPNKRGWHHGQGES